LDPIRSLTRLAALSDSWLVGLVIVGSKVGVFQLNSSVPTVNSVPLTHGGDLSLSFEEAFDLSQIFVTVRCKRGVCACL
jgi:hypothetical protein